MKVSTNLLLVKGKIAPTWEECAIIFWPSVCPPQNARVEKSPDSIFYFVGLFKVEISGRNIHNFPSNRNSSGLPEWYA